MALSEKGIKEFEKRGHKLSKAANEIYYLAEGDYVVKICVG